MPAVLSPPRPNSLFNLPTVRMSCRVAQRPERRRVLEILRRTEIGGNRLVEVSLLAHQNCVASFFHGELRRGHSPGGLAVDDDIGARRRAVHHHQRIHRRQMKQHRRFAAGSNIDRPHLGRIARLAYRDDVLTGTQARQVERCDPRRIAFSIDLKLCALRSGVNQRLAWDHDRRRGWSGRPSTAVRTARLEVAYLHARFSFHNRRRWLLDSWRHRSLGNWWGWAYRFRRPRSSRRTIVFRANMDKNRDRNHQDHRNRAQHRVQHQPRWNGRDFLESPFPRLPAAGFLVSLLSPDRSLDVSLERPAPQRATAQPVRQLAV